MLRTMKNGFSAVAISTMLLAASLDARLSGAGAETGAEPAEADIAAARSAAKELGTNLKAELVAALEAGGPSTALGVCRTVAPSIAENASKAHGLKVGRTALKVRNPDNAPDAFEQRVLKEFVEKIAAGSNPDALEHAEIVSEGGVKEFRYMKAIPTAAKPCLACHGANVAPELKAQILDLYPEDQATGFKAGELRGAFTVRKVLE